MSLDARNISQNRRIAPKKRGGAERIGDILLQNGALDPGDLFKALALQRYEDLRLGEMLLGLQATKEHAVADALGEQAALPVVDLVRDPPSRDLAQVYSPVEGIKQGFVIWKKLNNTLVVAISDPSQRDQTRAALADISTNIVFVLSTQNAILRYYQTTFQKELSEAANTRCPEPFSIRGWHGLKPKIWGGILFAVLVAAAALAPQLLVAALLGWILVALIGNSFLKLVTLIAFLRHPKGREPDVRAKKLPKISIMVPLLRESDILDRLVDRMSTLVYPKELLEICIVYEADDTETKDHLAARRLPYWMRAIEVPASHLQTKPRALNYALDFCRGDVIGIYDAEDAPEPDQLYRVVETFENAAENVACVQCRLDYYNSKTNWLSRCFTIEYAILFRVILPGLQRLGLPIPLGGTSVFFRRDHLEKLGRWDAHNVTEDADLGMRLHRQGMRCICAPATTYEEANFRILPWVRQRSRWLKGFLQTWITHLRSPVALYQQLGGFGFVVFHILFLGTFTSFAATPLVLPLWAFSMGYELPLYSAVSPTFINILVVAFLATEALLLVLGFVALRQREDRTLFAALPLMLFYWPIGSFAAYKALYELFVKPVYWDKTCHGINDREHQSEIERLTAPSSAV